MFRLSHTAPHPSTKCQQLFGQLCIKDNKLANEFLNGLLNQLNWSFSEFIGMLQEVRCLYPRFVFFDAESTTIYVGVESKPSKIAF